MDWMQTVNRILNIVVSLAMVAEGVFGPKTGSMKKQAVKVGTKDFIGLMKSVSTGGQRETWEQIEKSDDLIDEAIEIGVKAMKTGERILDRVVGAKRL